MSSWWLPSAGAWLHERNSMHIVHFSAPTQSWAMETMLSELFILHAGILYKALSAYKILYKACYITKFPLSISPVLFSFCLNFCKEYLNQKTRTPLLLPGAIFFLGQSSNIT